VTSQVVQIELLIADIDRLLAKKGNRLSRVLSDRSQEQRQVLQRVRNFLVSLEPSAAQDVSQPSASSGRSSPSNQAAGTSPLPARTANELEQQLRIQISPLMQALQTDVESLRQQREALIQEIRQLEQRRLHDYSLAQQQAQQQQLIGEFLQVLRSRLPEVLPQQLGNTQPEPPVESTQPEPPVESTQPEPPVENTPPEPPLESTQPEPANQQFLAKKLSANASVVFGNTSNTGEISGSLPWQSPEQLEHMRQLTMELDQRLLALDTTVNVVFDALQRNIQGYYDSLNHALEKMHSKGVQSEHLFTSFVSNMVQQVRQPSSANLPSNFWAASEQNQTPVTQGIEDKGLGTQSPIPGPQAPIPSPNLQLPYAGVELSLLSQPYQPLLAALQTETDAPPSTSSNPPTDESKIITYDQSEVISDADDEQEVNTFIQVRTDATEQDTSLTYPELVSQYVSLTEMPTAPDLDLSPPHYQASSSHQPTNPTQISQTAIIDPVDELYASLFGTTSEETGAGAGERSAGAGVQGARGEFSPMPPANNPSASSMPPASLGNENITSTTIASTTTVETALETVSEKPAQQQTLQSQELRQDARSDTPPLADTIKSLTDLLNLGSIQGATVAPQPQFSYPSLLPRQGQDWEQTIETVSSAPLEEAGEQGAGSREPGTDEQGARSRVEAKGETSPQPPAPSPQSPAPMPLIPTPSGSGGPSLPQSPVPSPQSPAPSPQSPAPSSQFPVPSPQFPVPSPQSPIAPEAVIAPPEIEEDFGSDSVSPWLLENYIPASKNEHLLPTEEAQPSPAPEKISLDQQMWQQLQEDLATLEGHTNTEFDTPPSQVEVPEAFTNSGSDSFAVLWESPEDQEKKKEVTQDEGGQEVRQQQEADIPPLPPGQFLIPPNAVWYMGIDLGTTGISAALFNTSSCEVYPIFWSAEDQAVEQTPQPSPQLWKPEHGAGANFASLRPLKRYFRLPAVAELPAVGIPHEADSLQDATAIKITTIDDLLSGKLATISAPPTVASVAKYDVFAAHLKPFLQVGLPYISPTTRNWQPMLQLSKFSTVPLIWVRRTLTRLLSTINPNVNNNSSDLKAAVSGLDTEDLGSILEGLGGVIFSCPSAWSEQYRFNIREAVLESQLVQNPEQIYFVEDAIATLLSDLPQPDGTRIKLPGQTEENRYPQHQHWVVGDTLVINAGAVSTELALVNLPVNMENLVHSDFLLHSFAYAGDAIDQDIICQLLCNPRWRRSRFDEYDEESREASHWQPSIPGLDDMHWDSLELETLDLPRAGETDLMARIRLQQVLTSSLLGQAVMDAAIAVKLILQNQDACNLELADKRWLLRRQDLEAMVLVPYVQRLNRELNRVLVTRGITTEAIHQVICTGGTASLAAITRWLRQKLPNATITQDLYRGESGTPTCSRVAYGLAMLPLHPQVLEVPKQQYSDYFLFAELLRVTPNRPITFGEIIRLLEERGINTFVCQQRLLSFLENQLPPGLVPNDVDSCWLTENSRKNADYQALTAAPLFEKQGTLTFVPNTQQLLRLRRYLNWLIVGTHQSFDEPYTVNLAAVVGN
jgi:hypothetical protein